MTSLRDGWSWRGIILKLRAFDQKDFLEAVRERPRGEESRDTGAEDDGFAMWLFVHATSVARRPTWDREWNPLCRQTLESN